MSVIDLNGPRTTRQKTAAGPTSDESSSKLPVKKGPIGFPTSKIIVHSPGVSRVGLSRKSGSTIKSLHPNRSAKADIP